MNKLIAFSAVILTAFSVSAAEFSDSLLATVGDVVITLYNVQHFTGAEEARLARAYSGKDLEEQITRLRRQALDTLIERELAFKEFESLKATVPANLIQERLNSIVSDRAGGSLPKFEEALNREGLTIKDFREQLRKDIAVELIVRDRITRGNFVSDPEIDSYYEKNKNTFTLPRKFRISVIQLRKDGRYAGKVNETFQEIMNKLKAGTPFSELAKQYSEGSNAAEGGGQGWMANPNESLFTLIKDMAPGQTASKMAEIGNSFYAVRLDEVDSGGIRELTPQLREQIRKKLEKDEETRRYKQFVQELYMKYPVRRLDGK